MKNKHLKRWGRLWLNPDAVLAIGPIFDGSSLSPIKDDHVGNSFKGYRIVFTGGTLDVIDLNTVQMITDMVNEGADDDLRAAPTRPPPPPQDADPGRPM